MQPHIHTDPNTGQQYVCGLNPADIAVMKSRPQLADTLPVIDESQWPKRTTDSFDQFMPFRWDQGQQGSCGGHGSVAAFTAAWNYQFAETGKPVLEFSPTFEYGMVNGGRDNGSTPEELMQSLDDNGVCLRSTVGPGQIYKSKYPQAAFTEALRFRADRQAVFHTFEELATARIMNKPVYTGIFVGNHFTPDANGVIKKWDGAQVGGHCTAQIGDLEYKDGLGWGIWTLNSWGSSWGRDGWVWLHRSFFDGGLPVFAGVAILSCRPDPKDSTPTPEPKVAA